MTIDTAYFPRSDLIESFRTLFMGKVGSHLNPWPIIKLRKTYAPYEISEREYLASLILDVQIDWIRPWFNLNIGCCRFHMTAARHIFSAEASKDNAIICYRCFLEESGGSLPEDRIEEREWFNHMKWEWSKRYPEPRFRWS